ncbi:MAG: rhodanese-like domain-containing protein [Clostridia bacterium]|jgi:rhodanese-related sulfurtransferase|nr:rhodanese-like domain-containing protein [Clostridia bacterium]
MKLQVKVISAILVLLFAGLAGCGLNQVKEKEGYNYISAEELKGKLEAKEELILLDILVEEEYVKGHIAGSIATYAYPVQSEKEKAKLAAVVPLLKDSKLPVIVICPGGGGGATRTVDFLVGQGIANERLIILSRGFNAWPYAGFVRQETALLDKEKGEVRIKAKVNGKYFETATRHGIAFEGGSNGAKAVLAGLGSEKMFHDLLIELGSMPGNNLEAKPEFKGQSIEGDSLNVTINWEGLGKEISISEAIIQSGEQLPMQIKFGGNMERAISFNTGCILCLDSCPVGITSDSSHPWGSVDDKGKEFRGDRNVLPADGTVVTVTFKLAN